MLQKEFNWKTNAQIVIYGRHWSAENPKAVVCLVHGLGEHINRYDHLARYFNQAGFVVIGNDHCGHGRSEGKRGHVSQYDNFLMEVRHLLATAKAHYKGLPIFLYGHSMGGNIVLNYVLEKKPNIAGIITTGAWIKLAKPPSALLYQTGKLVSKIAPSITQSNDLDPRHISTNPVEVDAYKNDPLVHGQISLGMAVGVFKAADRIAKFSGSLSAPLLAMHGEQDQIVSAEGTTALEKRMQSPIEVKIWEGLFHEIHNEPNQEEIFDYVIEWMEKQMTEG
ncbi:MAG: lysophospholipase [Bacteroidota bacterium]